MIIKIKFKNPSPNISVGDICRFDHPELDFFLTKYIGNSRIDGYPLFDILTKSSYPFMQYNLRYKGLDFSIESADLVQPLEDNYSTYRKEYQENMDDFLTICKSIFGITEDDLMNREKFKAKLRDIKLSQILN